MFQEHFLIWIIVIPNFMLLTRFFMTIRDSIISMFQRMWMCVSLCVRCRGQFLVWQTTEMKNKVVKHGNKLPFGGIEKIWIYYEIEWSGIRGRAFIEMVLLCSFIPFIRSLIPIRCKRHVNNKHSYFSVEKYLHSEWFPFASLCFVFETVHTYAAAIIRALKPIVIDCCWESSQCNFNVDAVHFWPFSIFMRFKSHLNPIPMIRKQHFIHAPHVIDIKIASFFRPHFKYWQ